MDLSQCQQWIQTRPHVDDLFEDGNGLLHLAVINGDASCVQAALNAGASPNLRGELGFTALELARYLNRPDLATLLGDAPPAPIPVLLQGSSSLQMVPTERFKDLFGASYLPFMDFGRYDILRAVHRLSAEVTQKGYMHMERRWLGKAYAPDIASGQIAPVSIRWIDPELGYGLFAEKRLAMWQFIGVYTGEVKKRPLFGRDLGDYVFRYPIGEIYEKKYLIDSEKEGNICRFINHSDTPNCLSSAVFHLGIMHLLVFTQRPIAQGEQLSFDYGEHLWQGRAYRAVL